MAIADAAVGVDQAIQNQITQRLYLQQYAAALAHQNNQESLDWYKADLERQRLDQDAESNRILRLNQQAALQSEDVARKAAAADKAVDNARAGRETWQPGQFVSAVEPGSPVAGWQGAGVQIGQSVPAMAPRLYTSPTDTQGTPGAAPSSPVGYLLTPTSKQAEDARKASDTEWQRGIQQELADLKAGAAPKEPTPHFTVQQTFDDTGKPNGLVKVNGLTGEVTPIAGPNIRPMPGASQLAVSDKNKKDALSTLDQIDAAIDNAKGLIGPGAGRAGKIEQLIGNPDPRLNALGTKLQLGKMQVDAGIGGMRAAASPQLIQRWDNLLSQNLNPDALHASIQAMREVLGGAPPATTDATPPPRRRIVYDTNGRPVQP